MCAAMDFTSSPNSLVRRRTQKKEYTEEEVYEQY